MKKTIIFLSFLSLIFFCRLVKADDNPTVVYDKIFNARSFYFDMNADSNVNKLTRENILGVVAENNDEPATSYRLNDISVVNVNNRIFFKTQNYPEWVDLEKSGALSVQGDKSDLFGAVSVLYFFKPQLKVKDQSQLAKISLLTKEIGLGANIEKYTDGLMGTKDCSLNYYDKYKISFDRKQVAIYWQEIMKIIFNNSNDYQSWANDFIPKLQENPDEKIVVRLEMGTSKSGGDCYIMDSYQDNFFYDAIITDVNSQDLTVKSPIGPQSRNLKITEAEAVIKSSQDLQVILDLNGVNKDIFVQKKYYEKVLGLSNKNLIKNQPYKTKELYAVNNYVVYGLKSSLGLNPDQRLTIIQLYTKTYKKLPRTLKEWNEMVTLTTRYTNCLKNQYNKDLDLVPLAINSNLSGIAKFTIKTDLICYDEGFLRLDNKAISGSRVLAYQEYGQSISPQVVWFDTNELSNGKQSFYVAVVSNGGTVRKANKKPLVATVKNNSSKLGDLVVSKLNIGKVDYQSDNLRFQCTAELKNVGTADILVPSGTRFILRCVDQACKDIQVPHGTSCYENDVCQTDYGSYENILSMSIGTGIYTLKPGEKKSVDCSHYIDKNTLIPGEYDIEYLVDTDNNIKEKNDNNNKLQAKLVIK